jgi:hypothetical protein
MMNATEARKLTEAYHEDKKREIIEKTENYIETTVSKFVETEAKKGLSTVTLFPSASIDRNYFKSIMVDEKGFECEFRPNKAIIIKW